MSSTPPRQLDLQLLRVFVAVAEQSSFSKAAVSRGITQEIVGAELLHRDTHRVYSSTAGIALFERAAPHIAALASAVHDLPEDRESPSGELRITCSCDFGQTMLPTIIASFSLRFPEVTFDVDVTNNVRASSGRGRPRDRCGGGARHLPAARHSLSHDRKQVGRIRPCRSTH